jgi:hypothetical protein
MSLQFRVDPATKSIVKVTEAPTTEDELRTELQAAADAAQNRLNLANESLTQADAAVKEAGERYDAAVIEQAAAQDEVNFSSQQLGELADAAAVLADLAQSTPESENVGDSASEAVSVPVTVAAE